jgi:ATP-dependent Clp protease protease subunit
MTAPWSRVFYFDAHVNQATVTTCLRKVGEWLDADATLPVEIALSSGGGYIDAGFRFVEDVRRWRQHGAVIDTRASGFTGSMAGVMLQAGRRRRIGAESTLHLHIPSNRSAGGDIVEIRETLASLESHYSRVMTTYAETSGFSTERLRHEVESRRNWYLPAGEALAWNFADEIV